MHFRDILYVTTIAEEGGFSAASNKLFVSQPALSQAVARIEKDFGQPLFIREGRRVVLTPLGDLYVAGGHEILHSVSMLDKKLHDAISSKEHELKLGISSFYSEYHLARILPVFRELYPSSQIKLVEDVSFKLEEYVLNGDVDFCMVPLPLAHEGMDYQVLLTEQILFAIPSGSSLASKILRPISGSLPVANLQAFSHEPFVFLKKQRFAEMGLMLCGNAGFTPNIAYETTNWNTVSALIASGLGVGFLPEVMTRNVQSSCKQPIFCKIAAMDATRPYVAAYKKGSTLSHATLNFIDVAKETFMV